MPDKLTVEGLEGIISLNLEQPLGEGELSDKRTDLIKRFFAEPYGDEDADLSSVVDTSVRDVIYWALPEIMEIVLGSDKVVSFDPVGAEDEAAAEQETDVVNHYALHLNPAFHWAYSWVHDAFLQVNGYVDVAWEDITRRTTDRYRGVTEDEITQIIAELEEENEGATVEVVSQDEYTETVVVPDPMTGMPVEVEVPLLDVRLKIDGESKGKPVIQPLPPEEVVVNRRHNSLMLTDAAFVAWTPNLPRSDLVAMGLEPDMVEGMAPNEHVDRYSGNEKDTRFRVGENDQTSYASGDPQQGQMESVGFAKCYVRADLDGDGVAELLRVYATHDGEVLKWADHMKDRVTSVEWPYCIEEVEACGIVALSPFIVPHRHQGVSLGELLMQTTKILTELKRQMLDNIALQNQPRRHIDEASVTDTTYDDLEGSAAPGTKLSYDSRQGGNPPILEPAPDVVTNSLAAMEFFKADREETGITRLQQGLSGEAVGSDTWRGQAQLMDAANKKLRMIARCMAECGFKEVFQLIHMLIRKHADKEFAIRLRGEWIDVDPRSWRERSDMTVNIGLGTGNKDLQLGHFMNLWGMQGELMAMGGVTPEHRFNAFEKIIELAGVQNPERYALDPEKQQWQPPEPPADPLVELKRIEAQTQQMKLQVDADRIQLDREKMAFEAQMKAAELELAETKLQLEAAKVNATIETQRDKIRVDALGKSADHAIKREQMDRDDTNKDLDRLAGALAADRQRAATNGQNDAN